MRKTHVTYENCTLRDPPDEGYNFFCVWGEYPWGELKMQNTHCLLRKNKAKKVTRELAEKGYSFIRRADHSTKEQDETLLAAYRDEYHHFPEDPHLNTGEGQRIRRYARFELAPQTGELRLFPHDTFFQSAHFDELYGDIHREFSPLNESILTNQFFLDLIRDDFYTFPMPAELFCQRWEISTHLIRIAAVCGNEKGRPAPEGVHQDGYHFGVARLFSRVNLTGAQSRVHDLQRNVIDRAYLRQPLDALYMNDRAIFHSVEPFEAKDPKQLAYRDVAIVLYQPLQESPQAKADSLPLCGSGILRYLEGAVRFTSEKV